jgi:hypothetical protein
MNKYNNNLLWKYAGMATRFAVAIALSLYAGIRLDKWMKTSVPLASWLLPLLFIIVIIIKAVKDTSPKK